MKARIIKTGEIVTIIAISTETYDYPMLWK